MATKQALINEIEGDLHRSDLTTDVENAIDSAVRYYQRESFWFLETITTFTATASTTFFPVPSDLKDFDSLLVTVAGSKLNVIRKSYVEIDEKDTRDYTGIPVEWAYYQDQIRLYPLPMEDYVMTLSYHRSLDAPSASGSNAWTGAGYDLLRFRVGWDISQHKLHAPEMAMTFKQSEIDAYNSIIGENTKKKSSGKIRKSGW